MTESDREEEDEGLVGRARSDPDAFASLYRQHYDGVFRYCVHRLFERAAAEDVTSAVFLKVARNIRGFRGDDRGFRYWLYRIATNAVNDYLRAAARTRRMLKLFAWGRPQAQVEPAHAIDEPADTTTQVRESLLSLKPQYQTIITLHYFENLKLVDIAAIMGSSPATVRSQLSRALAQLRRKLKPLYIDDREEIYHGCP